MSAGPRDIELRRFPNPSELAGAAANEWITQLLRRPAEHHTYSVAISGGRIAAGFFRELSRIAAALEFSFKDVHFFWADERCVPWDHPDSNFLLANTHLLEPLCVARRYIHRIKGELDPEQAAIQAEQEMYDTLCLPPGLTPALDLVILGMGEDGHVASLFPGEDPALIENPAVYRAVTSPKPPPLRITLGYRAIISAREVWVLASGAGKEEALRKSLETTDTPLGHVLHRRAHSIVYTDLAVA